MVNAEFPSCDLCHTQVAMVADIGGTSLEDCVKRMMGFLMSNPLALQYNLSGARGKRRFKELPLFNVLYGKFELYAFIYCS